jgi:nucleotide-binding universal stress UspA family protein
MFRKMLIANDGSKGGGNALSAAIDLARRLELDLHMVYVEELPKFPGTVGEILVVENDAAQHYTAVIDHAKVQALAQNVKFEAHLIEGHAVPCIVDFIQQGGYDLLVVGFMGHSALYNRVIGSTTDRLVELAPCNVMVIK